MSTIVGDNEIHVGGDDSYALAVSSQGTTAYINIAAV